MNMRNKSFPVEFERAISDKSYISHIFMSQIRCREVMVCRPMLAALFLRITRTHFQL